MRTMDLDLASAAPGRPDDKFARRRRELAEAAQATLAEHGHAGTSLREIAQRSGFSHGVFHYYFADKDELIAYCVLLYKEECATRYDEVVATAATADDLLAGFGRELVASLVDDGPRHRLWYDLRNLSRFEPRFRDDVRSIDSLLEAMIGRVLDRYAELAGAALAVPRPVAYGLLDGLFERAVTAQAHGGQPEEGLAADALAVVRLLVPDA